MAINVLVILGFVLLFFGVMWKSYRINRSAKPLIAPDTEKRQ